MAIKGRARCPKVAAKVSPSCPQAVPTRLPRSALRRRCRHEKEPRRALFHVVTFIQFHVHSVSRTCCLVLPAASRRQRGVWWAFCFGRTERIGKRPSEAPDGLGAPYREPCPILKGISRTVDLRGPPGIDGSVRNVHRSRVTWVVEVRVGGKRQLKSS